MVVEDFVDGACGGKCSRCEKMIDRGERYYGDPGSVPQGEAYPIWCEACNVKPATPAKDDGGPAFPEFRRVWEPEQKCYVHYAENGMSLRDWFAGRATDGDIEVFLSHVAYQSLANERVQARYAYADAMLTKRAKGGGE